MKIIFRSPISNHVSRQCAPTSGRARLYRARPRRGAQLLDLVPRQPRPGPLGPLRNVGFRYVGGCTRRTHEKNISTGTVGYTLNTVKLGYNKLPLITNKIFILVGSRLWFSWL
jgi:hypothetical protein